MTEDKKFLKLNTPKYEISTKDGNNIIEYGDSIMIVESMERLDSGVVFSGVVFPTLLKQNIFSFFDHGSTYVNEFLLDLSSPNQEKNYSFYVSDIHLLTKVKKLMKMPIAFEPLDCIFSEILHTAGKNSFF